MRSSLWTAYLGSAGRVKRLCDSSSLGNRRLGAQLPAGFPYGRKLLLTELQLQSREDTVVDRIVPSEQGCTKECGKALSRPEQACPYLGLPSVDRDASQAE